MVKMVDIPLGEHLGDKFILTSWDNGESFDIGCEYDDEYQGVSMPRLVAATLRDKLDEILNPE